MPTAMKKTADKLIQYFKLTHWLHVNVAALMAKGYLSVENLSTFLVILVVTLTWTGIL